MGDLIEYIVEHCVRGTCTCEKCMDVSDEKIEQDVHTADIQFFKVTLKNSHCMSHIEKNAVKDNFIRFINNHKGVHKDIDIFDGKEHDFIEIGAWIGDNDMALMLMGMGELLDMWKVITPDRVASEFSEETRRMLTDAGCILIKYNRQHSPVNSSRRSIRV